MTLYEAHQKRLAELKASHQHMCRSIVEDGYMEVWYQHTGATNPSQWVILQVETDDSGGPVKVTEKRVEVKPAS